MSSSMARPTDMPMLFTPQHSEKCARCEHPTLRRVVEVQDDWKTFSDRAWERWRCDRCQFERTVLPVPARARDSRTVIC
jgi:hypothetical protein